MQMSMAHINKSFITKVDGRSCGTSGLYDLHSINQNEELAGFYIIARLANVLLFVEDCMNCIPASVGSL